LLVKNKKQATASGVEEIAKELNLRLLSRYDILLNNDPKKEAPPKEQSSPSRAPTARRGDEATGRPDGEQDTRPEDRATGKGILVRRGFEWREDQLRPLKKLSLEEQLEGKPGSMSQMVRDALDVYLQKRVSGK
jgi:hypothetical protein